MKVYQDEFFKDSKKYSDYDSRLRYYEISDRERKTFIDNSRPIPCPAQMYADWLSKHIEMDGPIGHFYDYDYGQRHMFMPTRSTTTPIPEAYGAMSLDLFIDYRYASIPIDPHQSWGHNTVLTYVNGTPWTNDPWRVVVYRNLIPMMSEEAQQIIAERTPKGMKPSYGWKSPVTPIYRAVTEDEAARQEGVRAINVLNLELMAKGAPFQTILPVITQGQIKRKEIKELEKISAAHQLSEAWVRLSASDRIKLICAVWVIVLAVAITLLSLLL